MMDQPKFIECIIKPNKRGRPKLTIDDIQNKIKEEVQLVKIEYKKFVIEL